MTEYLCQKYLVSLFCCCCLNNLLPLVCLIHIPMNHKGACDIENSVRFSFYFSLCVGHSFRINCMLIPFLNIMLLSILVFLFLKCSSHQHTRTVGFLYWPSHSCKLIIQNFRRHSKKWYGNESHEALTAVVSWIAGLSISYEEFMLLSICVRVFISIIYWSASCKVKNRYINLFHSKL